jgi:acyl carrier protein
LEHDTRKFRGPRQPGQVGAPARPAKKARPARTAKAGRAKVKREPEGPKSAAEIALAAVIAEVLPQHNPDHPPALSSELYSDLFIDSRRFLMIIRGLERRLGLEIDDEDLLGVDLITYGDLVKFVGTVSLKKSGQSNDQG